MRYGRCKARENVMVTAMAAAERPAGCHEWPPGGGEEAAQP